MKIQFRGKTYQLVITDHAQERMRQRAVSIEEVVVILETGTVKLKELANKYWVFKKLRGRKDNLICLSVSLESPFLIVITALLNWRPKA